MMDQVERDPGVPIHKRTVRLLTTQPPAVPGGERCQDTEKQEFGVLKCAERVPECFTVVVTQADRSKRSRVLSGGQRERQDNAIKGNIK